MQTTQSDTLSPFWYTTALLSISWPAVTWLIKKGPFWPTLLALTTYGEGPHTHKHGRTHAHTRTPSHQPHTQHTHARTRTHTHTRTGMRIYNVTESFWKTTGIKLSEHDERTGSSGTRPIGIHMVSPSCPQRGQRVGRTGFGPMKHPPPPSPTVVVLAFYNNGVTSIIMTQWCQLSPSEVPQVCYHFQRPAFEVVLPCSQAQYRKVPTSRPSGKQNDVRSIPLRLSLLFKSCRLWTQSCDFVPHN